jgi:hypothetical protein
MHISAVVLLSKERACFITHRNMGSFSFNQGGEMRESGGLVFLWLVPPHQYGFFRYKRKSHFIKQMQGYQPLHLWMTMYMTN